LDSPALALSGLAFAFAFDFVGPVALGWAGERIARLAFASGFDVIMIHALKPEPAF
jgi:hypothetical protein